MRGWLGSEHPKPGRIALHQRTAYVASKAYARLVNGGFEPPDQRGDVLENAGFSMPRNFA
jgi:hypothetical protein